MSMLGINGALAGMYQLAASKGIVKTERADITGTSFINQLKKTGETESTSRVDAYTEYLRSKYGNVRIQNVGKAQQSLDRIGKSMSGSDVVIAPNILEQMANDTEKAAYYEGKIDDFFHATPVLKASFIGGCADSPERVAEVNAINKAKREKETAQRKANMERSREVAGEQKRQMDFAYQKRSMVELSANHAVDTSRVTYMVSPEVIGSAIAAYEKNIMEVAGSLNR